MHLYSQQATRTEYCISFINTLYNVIQTSRELAMSNVDTDRLTHMFKNVLSCTGYVLTKTVILKVSLTVKIYLNSIVEMVLHMLVGFMEKSLQHKKHDKGSYSCIFFGTLLTSLRELNSMMYRTVVYADDVAVAASGKYLSALSQRLQTSLKQISRWKVLSKMLRK